MDRAIALKEVTKQVYCKWFSDTVFCVSEITIERILTQIYNIFHEGRKRLAEKGKENSAAVKAFKKLADENENLFDVFQKDEKNRKSIEKDWGIKMSGKEHEYYQDQKRSRKMFCSTGVDPVWYLSVMRTQRLRERQQEYSKQRAVQFEYRSLAEIFFV